jgi:hypothetical protein
LSKSGNKGAPTAAEGGGGGGGEAGLADDEERGESPGVDNLDKAKKAAWEGDLTKLKAALKKQDFMHEDEKGRCVASLDPCAGGEGDCCCMCVCGEVGGWWRGGGESE